MSKQYRVTFTETYVYTKNITIDNNEDIDEIIRDPLECPTVRDMSDEQFSEADVSVCNDYEVENLDIEENNMQETLYVIIRHDEGDGRHTPHCFAETEQEAIAVVKYLNETDGLSITLDEDGSLADITNDDAIWFSYRGVEKYNKEI